MIELIEALFMFLLIGACVWWMEGEAARSDPEDIDRWWY